MAEICNDPQRVLLGMSGGLDSTMSALLLREAGYTVIGLTLKTWSVDAQKQESTIEKASNLARELDIEHHVADIEQDFRNEVVSYFCNEYLHGRTPNPCNRCNPVIKWPWLLKKAKELRCEYVATGHYVQKKLIDNKWHICKGIDPSKDQSYFLWNLDQETLERALFPLGRLTKKEVRNLATKNNLKETARQKESMGVCFLDGMDYRNFLSEHLKLNIPSGNIVDESNHVLGQHQGLPFFTIGQKKGLGLDDKNYFVTKLRADTNEVVVSKTASLKTLSLQLTNFYFTNLPTGSNFEVSIRIRGIDKIPEIPGNIKVEDNILTINFDKPAWGITPGQSIVFYRSNCVIGGGIV